MGRANYGYSMDPNGDSVIKRANHGYSMDSNGGSGIERANYGFHMNSMDSRGYMTRTQLRNEMHKQSINLVYLEKCDVLIFNDTDV